MMENKILTIFKAIAQDHQDIHIRLTRLRTVKPGINDAETWLLPLLYELQDGLALYKNLQQTIIYSQLSTEHDLQEAKVEEMYFHITLLLRRCIDAFKRHDFAKGFVQLNMLIVMLVPCLEEERQYLTQALPQSLSVAQLESMAEQYQQLKFALPLATLACLQLSQPTLIC